MEQKTFAQEWQEREAIREMLGGLDPWPEKRPMSIVPIVVRGQGYLIEPYSGNRILKIPAVWAFSRGTCTNCKAQDGPCWCGNTLGCNC